MDDVLYSAYRSISAVIDGTVVKVKGPKAVEVLSSLEKQYVSSSGDTELKVVYHDLKPKRFAEMVLKTWDAKHLDPAIRHYVLRHGASSRQREDAVAIKGKDVVFTGEIDTKINNIRIV